MNELEQRIALAQLCEWHSIVVRDERGISGTVKTPYGLHPKWTGSVTAHELPDYTRDLNAQHEAEKFALEAWPDSFGRAFQETLWKTATAWPWHATAGQRAEAMCRVLWPERWKD